MGFPHPTELTPIYAQYTRGEKPDRASSEHQGGVVSLTFHAGRNRSVPPHKLNTGECWDLYNMYYPREGAIPQTRPGLVAYSATPAIWATGTVYAGGSYVTPIAGGSYYYEATTGGTSGTPEPTWPTTVGNTVVDNTVTWTCRPIPGAVKAITVFQQSTASSFVVFASLAASTTLLELYYLDQTTRVAKKISDLASSNTNAPTFLTYGQHLLIAQKGAPIKEWNGSIAGTKAKAHGHVKVDDYTKVIADETVTIGGRVFTFKATRTQIGEIAVGGSNNAVATNIRTAVNMDSWDVAATGSDADVIITATRSGTDGNSLPIVDGTGGGLVTYIADGTTPGVVLSGGALGTGLDSIETYQHPHPGIITTDKNMRVLCGDDPTAGYEDRLFFSGPGNAYMWASGDYGSGEYVDIGYKEGNSYSAIVPFLGEVFVHKNGQAREMYRLRLDPDPSTWTLERRAFANHSAALGPQCAVSVGDKHLTLDYQTFRVFQGTDTYDEIVSGVDGLKIYDIIKNPNSTGFITVDPSNMIACVFPAAGVQCAVFHYASRRWSRWKFSTTSSATLNCGTYNAAADLMLFGASDGKVYKLDSSVATDMGNAFISRVIGPTITGDSMRRSVVTHTIFDYQTIIAANVQLSLVLDREETNIKQLANFTTAPTGTLLYSATTHFTDDPGGLTLLYSATYARYAAFSQGDGDVIAPMIQASSGAIAANSLLQRLGAYGISGK